MTTQPEALRLAEVAPYLEGGERGQWIVAAAAELRRLHSLNQELLAALEKLARLGNGDHYGNSDGNMIARAAITKMVFALQHVKEFEDGEQK